MSYVSVSLSGGKDSTAMLLMMLERGEQINEVVFFDTGMEFPQMYEHIDRLEKDVGMEFTRLRPPMSFEFYMFDKVKTKGNYPGTKGYGWPRPRARWCTKLKTDAVDKHLKEMAGGDRVIQCIGIAADEPRRIRQFRYPLFEWGVTEAMALDYCRARGYDWGGLYDHFKRVSCWCCPLCSLGSARSLRRHHPDLWARLLDMEHRSVNTWRIDYSVDMLEERFAHEDKQMRLELE